ncbi:MAG TPA: PilZ domain-containing protein [Pyrinomonadaceae bacterium]|nr:PilZ domain-containing protein [Pyrinomonadaceae bacterium]
MPELTRSLIARLRNFISNRRRSPRYRVRLPVGVLIIEPKVKEPGKVRLPKLDGFTRDLSESGLALVVPAIRINDSYLMGEGHALLIVLETPRGDVEMRVAPVRYEKIERSETEKGYLLAVRIAEMSEQDRERFNEYLKEISKK